MAQKQNLIGDNVAAHRWAIIRVEKLGVANTIRRTLALPVLKLGRGVA
jgi:hypothetical protein